MKAFALTYAYPSGTASSGFLQNLLLYSNMTPFCGGCRSCQIPTVPSQMHPVTIICWNLKQRVIHVLDGILSLDFQNHQNIILTSKYISATPQAEDKVILYGLTISL